MLFYLRDISFVEWLIKQAAMYDRLADESEFEVDSFLYLMLARTYRNVRDEFKKRKEYHVR